MERMEEIQWRSGTVVGKESRAWERGQRTIDF